MILRDCSACGSTINVAEKYNTKEAAKNINI